MSAPPYMKLYVADYLGDTHHLGALEHGAYLLLLMAMWRAGGSLPAMDANLAKLARCTPDQWSEIRDSVLPFFKRSRGRLAHKRLTEELAKYESTSGKRSEAGKQGGRPKSSKNNEDQEAIALSDESNCRHNQNQNQKEEISEANASSPRAARSADFTTFWSAYPNKVAKVAAEKAYAKAIRSISGPDPPSVILAGVERAKASRQWREGFIPHPATWLNRGSWDDQPAEVIPPPPQPRHAERSHHDAKFDARQANYAAHERGADLAARLYREPG